jgi:hypothetical protein
MTSQHSNVDWFCYWLNGEEDPDTAKPSNTPRWRELRKQQEESQRRRSHTDLPMPSGIFLEGREGQSASELSY